MKRNPFGFVSIGRIVPEKNIERIIAILKKVRNAGFPVTLHLAGNLEENEYGREIARKIEFESDWILTTGFLDQNAKQTLLSGQSYALHGCRIEAFGIAVAEMASMGCIPFVTATGGAREIVPFPELHYETDEDAVAKIVALLEDVSGADKLRSRLPGLMRRFGPDNFKSQLRSTVQEMLESRLVALR